jgi:hypothetical protein
MYMTLYQVCFLGLILLALSTAGGLVRVLEVWIKAVTFFKWRGQDSGSFICNRNILLHPL